MIGNFKNPGVKWEQAHTDVNDCHFRSAAKGIGIPYGIYDTQADRGSVFLRASHDLPAFAVSCLRKWWQIKGRKRYPQCCHILILAETGASKWNPIEHRRFSQISRNWKAEPLDSYEKTLKFIRTTTTKTGLKVTARLDPAYYPTCTKVSKSDLAQLSARQKRVLPK